MGTGLQSEGGMMSQYWLHCIIDRAKRETGFLEMQPDAALDAAPHATVDDSKGRFE
jgi:hypothetical protein